MSAVVVIDDVFDDFCGVLVFEELELKVSDVDFLLDLCGHLVFDFVGHSLGDLECFGGSAFVVVRSPLCGFGCFFCSVFLGFCFLNDFVVR